MSNSESNTPLWTPSKERIENSNAMKFMKQVSEKSGFTGSTFHDLWEWSVNNPEPFWDNIWDFGDIIGDKGSNRISNGKEKLILKGDNPPEIIISRTRRNEVEKWIGK